MDRTARRRSLRTWSLTIRMVVLAVGVPLFVVAAVAAILLFFAHGFAAVMLAFVLVVGVIGAIVGASRDRTRGRELGAAEEPELQAGVSRLCALIDMSEPELWLSASKQANSWVTHRPGRRPRLYVTQPLLGLLTREELQAVVAHELTHIANGDALVMTVVSTPGDIAVMARGGIWGLPMLAIGLIAKLGSATLSRCRELAADAGSAAMTGRPSALASALMKVADSQTGIPDRDLREAAALNAFNLVAVPPHRHRWHHDLGRVSSAFATHPGLEARLRRLELLEREQQQPGRR